MLLGRKADRRVIPWWLYPESQRVLRWLWGEGQHQQAYALSCECVFMGVILGEPVRVACKRDFPHERVCVCLWICQRASLK